MEQQKKQSSEERIDILLDRSWGGRNGYQIYYIPIPREEAPQYISDHLKVIPQCFDRVLWIKEVEEGEELTIHEDRHKTKKWKAPQDGCKVKIKKGSCS